jgi:UDP-N-acetylglucosamine diphosphorylase/glucosamine-1-phosphate N-acetyltransferase
MHLIFFDNQSRADMLPLAFTRPLADMRCGILTIREKWQKIFDEQISFSITEDYLQKKFPLKTSSKNMMIAGNLLPSKDLIDAILSLNENDALYFKENLLAICLNENAAIEFSENKNISAVKKEFLSEVEMICRPNQIFQWNEKQIQYDFELLTKGRKSAPVSDSNKIISKENIFLEDGATIECSILNAKKSKMYFAKNTEVMEGCMIRGSFSLGEHSVLKMGAKVYGATTIGQHSKVGGEVNNAVIFGFSNKAHDGFMGNSVIGEWCNWGADSNNSNLKNNYEEVKLWNYNKQSFEKTGTQFCGLIMADHSKCGINTMFNTGTVVGVSSNIFGSGFPRNFIPDFSWGGASGMMTYQTNKAIQTAKLVFERRGMIFDETEQEIFKHIFEITKPSRGE